MTESEMIILIKDIVLTSSIVGVTLGLLIVAFSKK